MNEIILLFSFIIFTIIFIFGHSFSSFFLFFKSLSSKVIVSLVTILKYIRTCTNLTFESVSIFKLNSPFYTFLHFLSSRE